MRVVEKFTRQGNAIKCEVTVEDPDVLVEPWVMTPSTMRLIPNAEAGLLPESPFPHEPPLPPVNVSSAAARTAVAIRTSHHSGKAARFCIMRLPARHTNSLG